MQALQPVHLWWVTITAPPSLTWLAPVGQQPTQGGELQWLHRSERISMSRVGNLPLVTVRIQSLNPPRGTRFSVLQAYTQALQPTHLFMSAVMA